MTVTGWMGGSSPAMTNGSTEDTDVAVHIDYYASLNSPWTHLGAARIEALAAKHGATLRIHPVDFGTIFPASGGLPLPKRAAAPGLSTDGIAALA